MQCRQCGTEYEAKRSTSEYCSSACRTLSHKTRTLTSQLPTDVQAEIEQHCSENNNGEREGSHSRAAMTERALSYQRQFGKRPIHGVHGTGCATEQEHRQTDAGSVGPLDVYSEARWARLEAKGYKWSPEWGWAVGLNDVEGFPMAVPVPGDPAYQAVSA